MDRELLRECGQRHMMFWRDGPKFFNVMRERVIARRKKAQALRIAARSLLVKTMDAWRNTSKLIKEERLVRRREREMETKVAAQRAQALAWAKSTNNESLVKSLTAEEEAAKMAKLMRETAKRDRMEELGLSDSSDDDDARIDREILRQGEAEASKLENTTESGSESKALSTLDHLGSAIVKGKVWKKKSADNALRHGTMLDSDRAARREQARRYHKVMDEMRRKMTSLHKERAGYADEQADWQSDLSEDKAKLKMFFQEEANKVERACNREIKYVSEIKVHMARKIYKLLTSVRAASEKILDYLITWHYFRRLRMPYFLKKTKSMKNRMILRNRLRLCSRLRYMMKGAPLYRCLRVKWRVFNCWLLMIENHYSSRTPGIKHHVKKLQKRVAYHELLMSRGVSASAYNYTTLNPLTTDLKACLLRWSLYTANNVANRGIQRLVAWRRRLVVLRTCFKALAEVSLGRNAHQRTLDKAAAKAAYEKAKAEELEAAIKAASLDNESHILSRANTPQQKASSPSSRVGTPSTPSSLVENQPSALSRTGTPNKGDRRVSIMLNEDQLEGGGNKGSGGNNTANSPSLSTHSLGTDGFTSNTLDDQNTLGPTGESSTNHNQSLSSTLGPHSGEGGGGVVGSEQPSGVHSESVTQTSTSSTGGKVELMVLDDNPPPTTKDPTDDLDEGHMENFPDSNPSSRPHSRSAADENNGALTPIIPNESEEQVAFLDTVSTVLDAPMIMHGLIPSNNSLSSQDGQDKPKDPFSARPGKCFAEKRVLADLHCWRNNYLSPQSHWSTTKRANSKRFHVVKHGAIDGPSFRSFIGGMHKGAVRRVALERVLLLDAFINRGKLGFRDYSLLAQPAPHQAPKNTKSSNKKSQHNGSASSSHSIDSEVMTTTQVIGEDNFMDQSVWGGFQIAEVNVFSEPGQGIFGICLAVAGDGNGSTELLPKGGVMAPHGQPKGRLLNFKLKHPYEHISSVTLYISTVIEAIQFHTRAPDGKKLRSSPLLGVPFSPDVHAVVLEGQKPTDTLVC